MVQNGQHGGQTGGQLQTAIYFLVLFKKSWWFFERQGFSRQNAGMHFQTETRGSKPRRPKEPGILGELSFIFEGIHFLTNTHPKI